jgi:hypothetical protein
MLECNSRPCYFHLPARSGGTGRRAGLKIPWYLVPCGFDPLLRDHFYSPHSGQSQIADGPSKKAEEFFIESV